MYLDLDFPLNPERGLIWGVHLEGGAFCPSGGSQPAPQRGVALPHRPPLPRSKTRARRPSAVAPQPPAAAQQTRTARRRRRRRAGLARNPGDPPGCPTWSREGGQPPPHPPPIPVGGRSPTPPPHPVFLTPIFTSNFTSNLHFYFKILFQNFPFAVPYDPPPIPQGTPQQALPDSPGAGGVLGRDALHQLDAAEQDRGQPPAGGERPLLAAGHPGVCLFLVESVLLENTS